MKFAAARRVALRVVEFGNGDGKAFAQDIIRRTLRQE